MEKEGHIVKLNKCDEDCFISPIVTTRKKDGSIKLALDSHELINNIALQLSSKESGEVWFSSLDLKSTTIMHRHQQTV